jgi:anti-sigma regulatory factor (Ser/Thr protein kinase)
VVVGKVYLESIEDLHRAKALVSPALGLSEMAVRECLTALSEAVANALTHGRRGCPPYCRVTVQAHSQWVHITVEDHGAGFDWAGLEREMPSWDKEHGRGVHLIRELMDRVTICSTPHGTRVEMSKRITPEGAKEADTGESQSDPPPHCDK